MVRQPKHFMGYDHGCDYCASFEKAKELSFCIRGFINCYHKCGHHKVEEVTIKDLACKDCELCEFVDDVFLCHKNLTVVEPFNVPCLAFVWNETL